MSRWNGFFFWLAVITDTLYAFFIAYLLCRHAFWGVPSKSDCVFYMAVYVCSKVACIKRES